jgi:hypothetical protein
MGSFEQEGEAARGGGVGWGWGGLEWGMERRVCIIVEGRKCGIEDGGIFERKKIFI